MIMSLRDYCVAKWHVINDKIMLCGGRVTLLPLVIIL